MTLRDHTVAEQLTEINRLKANASDWEIKCRKERQERAAERISGNQTSNAQETEKQTLLDKIDLLEDGKSRTEALLDAGKHIGYDSNLRTAR